MYERMLDKATKPTEAELTAYCGENAERFAAFNAYLTETYGTGREIRFPYGNQYGWCVTHRKGKKLICDVFAEAGAFTVMVRLSGTAFDSVYASVHADTRDAIDHKYPCGDGGWLHYRVTGPEQLEDIRRLLDAKCA